MPTPAAAFDVAARRAEFPALHQRVHDRPLVYLDNAATTQKPRLVLEALQRYYTTENANVHRGVHTLSERATAAYEGARRVVRAFINARSEREIVFTKNATEAINLVARAWSDAYLGPGDEVLISAMEHHSNIVPWQLACARTGAVLRVVPIDDRGQLVMEEFERLVTDRTKIVSIVHVSNALGTVNPVEHLVARAHDAGARVLIDGSQAAHHMPVDVRALDVDFFVFTGHKVYGPTGIGVLYGARGIGAGLGPIALRWLMGQTPGTMRHSIGPAYFIVGGFYVALAAAGTLPVAALCVLLAHFGGSILWVFSTVLLQMEVPDEFRGRVFAAELALVTLTSSISSYLTGYALDGLGWSPRMLAFTLGAGFAVPGALWLVMNARWKPAAHLETPDPVHTGEEEMLEGRIG